MKTILILLLFIKINATCQDAPSRLGTYVVRETTLNEFRKSISYRATVIRTDDDLSISERAPNDETHGNAWTHPVQVEYLASFPGRKELLYLNDSTEAFFINYVDLGTYVANNVFLYFYKDTLIKITYDGAEKVNSLLIEKYKGKALSSKTTKSKSDCLSKNKAGKRVDNTKISSGFIDMDNHIYSTLELNLIISSECELWQYVSVDIYDQSKFKAFLGDCAAFLINKKYLYIKHLKEIKEAEKSNL